MQDVERTDNLSKYQQQVMKTFPNTLTPREEIAYATMGLSGEAGEVTEIVKKWLAHGVPINKDRLTEELGDVLWYLCAIASLNGIAMQDVMAANVHKLNNRHGDSYNAEYYK